MSSLCIYKSHDDHLLLTADNCDNMREEYQGDSEVGTVDMCLLDPSMVISAACSATIEDHSIMLFHSQFNLCYLSCHCND